MRRTLILLVGAAAAVAAALFAAASLRLDDGSFTPKTATEFVRRGAGDVAAPPAQRSGSIPDYMVGTDNLAHDRQVSEAAEPPEAQAPAPPPEAPEPPPAPPAPPAPEPEPAVAAEPPD